MEEKRKGTRCQICTGCGLCPGVTGIVNLRKDIRILDEDALLGGRLPIRGRNRRLAVADIGTTTIAMLLYREDGSVEDRYTTVNPQVIYGADVLSRIKAAEDARKAEDMRQKARQALGRGIFQFKQKLMPEETLYLVYAANTTMTYLLHGLDTGELGHAPFTATHLKPDKMWIEGVECFGFPGLSAFVGGDILAGMLACGMGEELEKPILLVDLGTNGELVLGDGRRRIACSTAAGPAFEGGASRGVWGADMVSILAALKTSGCMDETGLLSEEYFETGIRVGNVLITQEAVRGVQLAKAAAAAGIEILLEKYGLSAERVDRVILAGGFGYYLRPEAAAEIGLLPLTLAGKAVTGGNTALSGCLAAGREILAGREDALKMKLTELVEGTQVINLAEDSSFSERYINRMDYAIRM